MAQTRPLSLRLDLETLALVKEAARKAGQRPSGFAKEAVLEKVGDTEPERTRQTLDQISREVLELRDEVEGLSAKLLVMTRALLIAIGDSEEDIAVVMKKVEEAA